MRPVTTYPAGRRMVPGDRSKWRGMQFQRGTTNPSNSQTIQAWHSLWAWSTFIQPQLDKIIASGANAVKMFVGVVAATDGTITRATLLDHIAQMASYCQAHGVYVYMTLWDGFTDPHADASPTAVGHAVAVAQMLDHYGNVIGLDLGNEITTQWSAGATISHLQVLQPAVRAVTSLPLSTGIAISAPSVINTAVVQQMAPYVDFYDWHPYYNTGDPAASDFATFRASTWYKPWVVGECGKDNAAGTAAVASRLLSLRDLANERDCFGSFLYQAIEYGGSPRFGYYPSLSSAANSYMSDPFSLWPTR